MKIIVRFKNRNIVGFNASWFHKTEDKLHIGYMLGDEYVVEHYNLADINAAWVGDMCICGANLVEVRR